MKTKQKHFTDERKQYYKLWYDYLKENPDYKAFCEWMREKREAIKKGKQGPLWTFKWPMKSMEGKQHPAIMTFLSWHDIHEYSFEEWWTWRTDAEVKCEVETLQYSPAPVEDCSIWLKQSIDQAIHRFNKDQGRDPTAHELRDILLHHMEKGSYGGWCLYLQISLSPYHSFSEVETLFKQIVKPRMLRFETPRFPDFSTRPKLPKKNELDRYLFEYTLRHPKRGKELPVKAIIEKVASSSKYGLKSWIGKGNDATTQRIVYEDIKKAERIISHTLYDFFPGQYDLTQKKRREKKAKPV